MRIAYFSPLPPARSGIADYSAALVEQLGRIACVTTFAERPATFNPAAFDVSLYQLGNNPFHFAPYEMALENPGVVVMHEANLHHLVADYTIKRNNWDAYLEEIRYDAGEAAFEYARDFVQTLKRAPDYEGVPMLRRILARSRGAIAHSRAVESELRKAGFTGPTAVIPHGAWICEPERMAYRDRLGLDASTPLIGIFGFLKPYKRIAESLRAFRRLARVDPRVRMILVGEPHPDLALSHLIRSLDLQARVRVLGFAPIQDFEGYLGACDIVLNLRYPTVGESSGTLLRGLGMGKAVLVSDVGSFSEYPDDVCLKVPVDSTEEDLIFEYLNLLVSRPEAAWEIGGRARAWVESECSWPEVAARYLGFLEEVVTGRKAPSKIEIPAVTLSVPSPERKAAEPPEYSPERVSEAVREALGWAEPDARPYVETHLSRLDKTLSIIPEGGPGDAVLEMGAYMQITPLLKSRLGYGEVRACYYGESGRQDHKCVQSESGEKFVCTVDLFDAEKDTFPYPGEHFTTVLCCELIEHLFEDPMHMMSEINRITRPGGHLVLTTPNITSLRAIAALLQGYQPGLFPSYIRPRSGEVDPRHNREYTPREIGELFRDAGYELTLLDTGPFREEPHPELRWVGHLLEKYILPAEHRGDGIYAVGRKDGPVRDRWPPWLYA
jgi:glycosyltransferase involved in cell wall biosynthesis/SAM-dependent methyltransferase